MEPALWPRRLRAVPVRAAPRVQPERAARLARPRRPGGQRLVPRGAEADGPAILRPPLLPARGLHVGAGLPRLAVDAAPARAVRCHRRQARRPGVPRQGCPHGTRQDRARVSPPGRVSRGPPPLRAGPALRVRALHTPRPVMAAGPVLVLGARSDIGRAIARLYAASGRQIVLAARRADTLEADCADLQVRYHVTAR